MLSMPDYFPSDFTVAPKCILDLLFVVETGKGLVSPKTFEEINEFVLRVISQYEISQTTTQVGYVAFSHTASVDSSSNSGFTFGEFDSQATLTTAVNDLVQLSQVGRRTDLGLDLAAAQLPNRPAVPNTVVVFATGISDIESSTVTAAQQLQAIQATEVIAVGVGGSTVNEQFSEELYAIGTNPDSTHVYKVSDTQESFDDIYVPLVRELCDGK